jgi:hypothetical protein
MEISAKDLIEEITLAEIRFYELANMYEKETISYHKHYRKTCKILNIAEDRTLISHIYMMSTLTKYFNEYIRMTRPDLPFRRYFGSTWVFPVKKDCVKAMMDADIRYRKLNFKFLETAAVYFKQYRAYCDAAGIEMNDTYRQLILRMLKRAAEFRKYQDSRLTDMLNNKIANF